MTQSKYNFDHIYYKKKYPDLTEKGIVKKSNLFLHYLLRGHKEGRFKNIMEENEQYLLRKIRCNNNIIYSKKESFKYYVILPNHKFNELNINNNCNYLEL